MQGQVEKKKEEEQLEEQRKKELAQKKQVQLHKPMDLSMSEGPMALKADRQETEQHERERRIKVGTSIGVQLINESKQIEEMGREAYERSVELELSELKKKGLKKGKKAAPKKKKPRYGWKMDDAPEPPAGDSEGEDESPDDEEKGKKE